MDPEERTQVAEGESVGEMPSTPPSAADRMRRLACCDSEVPCPHCPMRPENRHRSLKELTDQAVTDWR